MTRVDQILDEANSAGQFMELKGPCVDESVRSTIEAVTYSDISETDLNTFFQMMRLEIEGRIQEHEI
jgi:hypothetical protein